MFVLDVLQLSGRCVVLCCWSPRQKKTCVWHSSPHVNQISWTLDLISHMRHTRKARLLHESSSAAKLQPIMLSACQASTEFSGKFLGTYPAGMWLGFFLLKWLYLKQMSEKGKFPDAYFSVWSSMNVAPDVGGKPYIFIKSLIAFWWG